MQRDINLIITDNEHGKRLDQALAILIPNISRSRLQSWIKDGSISVNSQVVTPKHKVFLGDSIVGTIIESETSENLPQDIPLDIVFEDDDILVLNKPVGMVVHPGAGNPDGTLLNALLYHYPASHHIPRAGIVHRLDKDTSGVMVVAKTLEAQYALVQQLQERTVKRQYIALAVGEMIGGGSVNANIGRSGNDRLRMAVTPGGKEAITHYSILERYKGVTLLKCRLETGRTHQIRVHMAHIRHPLIGDTLYNGKFRVPKGLSPELRDHIVAFPRQALHAKYLSFDHPITGKAVSFKAHLPEDFEELLAPLEILEDEQPETFDWMYENYDDELLD